MRPLRLRLEGFTSFAQPVEVDFSGLDLFVISGATGAGKTSLVDALVFALYGRTPRVGEREAGELIHLGSKKAAVLFEFESSSTRYRIARTLQRNGSGTIARRQLEVFNGGGEWTAISDKEKPTRKKIGEILGLDFSGFTKSVVLPQGEFDRFLKGDPQQRRQILTDLLQLGRYQEMGRLARQRARELQSRHATLRDQLESNYSEATTAQLRSQRKKLKAAGKEKARLESRLELLSQYQPVAQEVRRLRTAGQDRQQKIARLLEQKSSVENEQQQRQEEMQRLADRIEALREERRKLRYNPDEHLRLEALVPQAEQLEKVKRSIQQLEQAYQQEQEELANLHQQMQTRQSELGRLKREEEACVKALQDAEQEIHLLEQRHGSTDSLQELAVRLETLAAGESSLKRLQTQLAERQTRHDELHREMPILEEQVQTLESELKQATHRISELRQRHLAHQLRAALQAGDECPVCEQAVAVAPQPGAACEMESVTRITEDLDLRLSDARGRLAAARGEADSLEQMIRLLQENTNREQDAVGEVQGRISSVFGTAVNDPEQQLEKIQRAFHSANGQADLRRQQLDQVRAKVQQTMGRLQELTQTGKVQEAHQQAHLRALSEHQSEQARLIEVEGIQRSLAQLQASLTAIQQARTRQMQLDQTLADVESGTLQLEETLAKGHRSLERLHEKLDEAEGELAETHSQQRREEKRLYLKLPMLASLSELDEAAQISAEQQSLQQEIHQQIALFARLEQRVTSLKDQIKQARTIRRQIRELKSQELLHKQLGNSLRAGAFMTFIQEEAFRRLAEAGSSLLQELSSQRYSFSVKQGSFEVVDHWNADETRGVSTLSGGESFLASLSLALALAESLGEFAPASDGLALDSLFLDEGFSTLDRETLDLVVQGIESLAANDRMVGVISHVPELAERFASQIFVEKSVGGSRLQVSS